MDRAEVLVDLIHKYNYRKVAEVGVLRGETAEETLRGCPDLEAYYMIDPWAPYEVNDKSHLVPWTIEQHEEAYQLTLSRVKGFPAARIMRMTSMEAAKHFEPGALDLVFIDANHAYEEVKRDIETWRPLVRPGGVISGHDYERFAQVNPAVDECFPDINFDEYFFTDPYGRHGGTFVVHKPLRVDVVVASLNQPGHLRKMFETAREATRYDLRFRVFQHSRHHELSQLMEQQVKIGDIIHYPYGVNRGLARSWNEGILDGYADGADAVLTVNDDLWFAPGDIDKIVEAAVTRRDCFVVSCMGTVRKRRCSMTWACFALNPIALEKVGCFDENFFPSSHEDQDYALRAFALGLRGYTVEDTGVHHVAVATRKSPELIVQCEAGERLCSKYFVRKWGRGWGAPKEGTWFRTPFNDLQFDNYIDPSVRNAPYPGYNREGIEYGA